MNEREEKSAIDLAFAMLTQEWETNPPKNKEEVRATVTELTSRYLGLLGYYLERDSFGWHTSNCFQDYRAITSHHIHVVGIARDELAKDLEASAVEAYRLDNGIDPPGSYRPPATNEDVDLDDAF